MGKMIDKLNQLEQKIEQLLKDLKKTRDALAKSEEERKRLAKNIKDKERAAQEAKKKLAQSEKNGKLVKAKMENLVKRLDQLEPVIDNIQID
jgi:chromosome segregation ATPase